ncbi:unnamed protein product [Meganyctiphanes norvegica]|uniref:Protein YIPF n=1 Tax=Meganyctiphanes norvegica TaxID=48144 RepID=A0AAV2RHM8_MEGNR
MAYNSWNQDQYGNQGWGDQNSFSYDMGAADFAPTDFGQEQQFQSFDYSTSGGSQPPPTTSTYSTATTQPPSFFTPGPSIMTPGISPEEPHHVGESLEDEPPLLEELGINPDAIVQKTLTVMNPFRRTDAHLLQDTDLAGPLVFCMAFGGFLLLSGKLSFGHIYGIGLLGCIALYGLLNMMSMSGVEFGVVVSVLGYCILPMVGVAGINVLISLQDTIGMILVGAAVIWCAISSSKLFVTALSMDHQQPLVAYPCALLYGVFALITIF